MYNAISTPTDKQVRAHVTRNLVQSPPVANAVPATLILASSVLLKLSAHTANRPQLAATSDFRSYLKNIHPDWESWLFVYLQEDGNLLNDIFDGLGILVACDGSHVGLNGTFGWLIGSSSTITGSLTGSGPANKRF
jgi:hypothetical protein